MATYPLEHRVLAAFIDLGELILSSEPVEYLGAKVPPSFVIGLQLEDRDKHSGRVWAVRFEVSFVIGAEPLLTEVTLRGLHEPIITRNKLGESVHRFEPDLFAALQDSVEQWQLRWVALELHTLLRFACAIAAREARYIEREDKPGHYAWFCNSVSVEGVEHSAEYRAFKWQGRTLEERSRNARVREIYEREVREAKQEGRRARTTERISKELGVSYDTAGNYVSAARRDGAIPKTSKGKTSDFTTDKRSKRGN